MPPPTHPPRARADFDWVNGAARPRYIRYKSLTSSRQEGTVKFSQKEWAGLRDGEYIFSIDTGSVECGAHGTVTYCVSQRIEVADEAVVRTVGRPHGAPLPPASVGGSGRGRTPALAAGKGAAGDEANHGDAADENDSADDCDNGGSSSSRQPYMFPVPLLETTMTSGETEDTKRVYAMVDRLSYLDWGLRTEDEVVGKRAASLASNKGASWDGMLVHDGAIWGEAAHGSGNTGPKTASTSEGYGEATVATAEKLLRLLVRLTDYVPAMRGWSGLWNLNADATFCDVGSGYGKVVIHAKLNTGCRSAVGIECVAKRVEISTYALQGLYGELDRAKLSDDLLKGVSFEAADACAYESLDYSHVYLFDRVFSGVTLAAISKVLQRSSFYVMISSRKPQVWWGVGLSKIQPVAKIRFKTTGREGMTAFVYINTHYIPGIV